MITTYATQNTRTLVNTLLPMSYQSLGNYSYKCVASLFIDDLQAGDLVQVTADGQADVPPEVTGGSGAMFARYLKASWSGQIDRAEGIMLDQPSGVDTHEHHNVLNAAGAFTAVDSRDMLLFYVMYAAGFTGPSSPYSLTMRYVDMTATVTRVRPDVVVTP